MKRILSILLSFLIVTLALPVRAAAGEASLAPYDDFGTFSAQVKELLAETADGPLLAGISFTVGSTEMTVDSETKELLPGLDAAPFVKDEQIMVPVRTLAECEDAEVSYDGRTKTATLTTDEMEVSFTVNEATATVSDGEGETVSLLATAPQIVDGSLYVPLDGAAQPFGYEVEESGETALLTKPFQTKRLIVKSAARDLDTFGAVQVIDGFRDLHVLQYDTEDEAREALERYQLAADVEYASPDSVVTAAETTHLSWGPAYIGADTYNDYLAANTLLPEVTVAVVDTGVDGDHTFLKDRLLSTGESFVDGETAYTDAHSHGTHVAGIVVDATLPNVKILPVKVLDSAGYGTILGVYCGAMFAVDQGCDVINMSLGGYGKTDLDSELAAAAIQANIPIVAAAGNESMECSACFLARLEEVIAVGAIESGTKYAYYSNYGATVDIWAPGSSIRSSMPKNKVGYKSGTSMAAPLVAACAAMLKTWDNSLSPRQIEGILQSHATEADLGVPGVTGVSKVLCVEKLNELTAEQTVIADAVIPDYLPGTYYREELALTLSCATPGAVIRYTIDGTVPTAETGTVYTGPLTFRSPVRLMAKAFLENAMDSYLFDGVYYVSPFPESLHGQEYRYYDTWTYTWDEPGVTALRVTFDENTYLPFPSPDSPPYDDARKYGYCLEIWGEDEEPVLNEYADTETGDFLFDQLRGRSVIVPGNQVNVFLSFPLTTDDYGFKVENIEPLYEEVLSPPEFVTDAGNQYVPLSYNDDTWASSLLHYEENMEVSLTGPEGAEIRYTTDGSIPTRSSALYRGPIVLTEPTRIRARAYKDGCVESSVASEAYYSSRYPESLHNVKQDQYVFYTWDDFEAPEDVKYLAVTFDEKTDLGGFSRRSEFSPYLRFIDETVSSAPGLLPTRYYGSTLAGRTVYVKGNSFNLQLMGVFSEGVEPHYGFKITDIQYIYDESEIVPIENIQITGLSSVKQEKQIQLSAMLTPKNANTGFLWTCPYGEVLSVDQQGVVTGLAGGREMVYACSNLVNSLDLSSNYINGAFFEVRVVATTPPVVKTAPAAKDLTYNKRSQALITPASVTGGTVTYSLDRDSGYSTAVPTAVNAGTYTVWYRVTGDSTHSDLAPVSVTAAIAKAAQPDALPQDAQVPAGTELADLSLPAGWSWEDPSAVLGTGENQLAAVYSDTQNYLLTRVTVTVTMAPPPHVHTLVETPAADPTCTAEGNLAYWTCSGCGETFADELGETSVEADSWVLEKIPHVPGEWETTLPPTVEREGRRSKLCTACGEALETEPIEKLPPPPPPPPAEEEEEEPEPSAWENPFTDVQEDAWFAGSVQYVQENGLMVGCSATQFCPTLRMSRAQLAQVLYNMQGKPDAVNASTFTDVSEDCWYFDAVSWAMEAGIVTGFENGQFAPEGSVTREQLAVMLWRCAKYMGVSREDSADLSSFADHDRVRPYAVAAMEWAVKLGIIQGKDGRRLDPGGTATRAEAAAMLTRYCRSLAPLS